MSDSAAPATDPGEPVVYQIRIRGHLGAEWGEWFGSMSITLTDSGDTLLTGPVADQAALHGLLRKVRDLGTPLLAVNRSRPGQDDGVGTTSGQRLSPSGDSLPSSPATDDLGPEGSPPIDSDPLRRSAG